MSSIYDHPTSNHSDSAPAVTPTSEKPADAPALTALERMYPSSQKATQEPDTKALEGAEADAEKRDTDKAGDEKEKNSEPPSEEAVEAFAEELNLDIADPLAGQFASAALDMGLDKAQASRLVELELQGRSEFWNRRSDEWLAELKQAGDVREMGRRANAVCKRFAPSGWEKAFDEIYIGNHPTLVRLLDNVGRELGL